MEQFKDQEFKSKESKDGAWMRPDLDEKPEIKEKALYSGHVKDGVAHGLGTIRGYIDPDLANCSGLTYPSILSYALSQEKLKDNEI